MREAAYVYQKVPTKAQVRRNWAKARQNRVEIWRARLRTGCCGLNEYLHRICIKDSAACESCECDVESVEHYIKFCPEYEDIREEFMLKTGLTLEDDLGFDLEANVQKNTDRVRLLDEFVNNSQRFVRDILKEKRRKRMQIVTCTVVCNLKSV